MHTDRQSFYVLYYISRCNAAIYRIHSIPLYGHPCYGKQEGGDLREFLKAKWLLPESAHMR